MAALREIKAVDCDNSWSWDMIGFVLIGVTVLDGVWAPYKRYITHGVCEDSAHMNGGNVWDTAVDLTARNRNANTNFGRLSKMPWCFEGEYQQFTITALCSQVAFWIQASVSW
jgi:hypothetical protein